MIRIVALTEAGQLLAKKIQAEMFAQLAVESELWFKPKPFTETIQNAFAQGDRLILICATGIAVRTLAPVLQSKKTDPAVLVLDELGEFVIPLLSGHEGGANEWASQISGLIKGRLVQTTAKPYLNPVYAVGMGCERNCPIEYLERLLEECLSTANLSIEQIDSINSIDIKADEVGLIALAKKLNKPFKTWDKTQLAQLDDLLSTKSDYIYSVVGVYGVAESAALFAIKESIRETAQDRQSSDEKQDDTMAMTPELVLNKQKNIKATCAIARGYPLATQQLSKPHTH